MAWATHVLQWAEQKAAKSRDGAKPEKQSTVRIAGCTHFLNALRKQTSYSYSVPQSNFKKIPGCPLGYWVSPSIIQAFNSYPTLSSYVVSNGQNITGDNKKFIRCFWEVQKNKINKEYWSLCARGGGYRRLYGNITDVILWTPEARNHYKEDSIARIVPENLRFKEGITWSYICSGIPSFRKLHNNELFEKAGTSVFVIETNKLNGLLALLNSCVARSFFRIIAPTLNFQVRDIQCIPVAPDVFSDTIKNLVECNYSISKQDWDAHETSWDFQENELIRLLKKGLGTIRVGFENAPQNNFVALDMLVEEYKAYWMEKFNQLHDNEEELNRQFIEIYGLQEELTPEVPLEEVTILQQGEISIEDK